MIGVSLKATSGIASIARLEIERLDRKCVRVRYIATATQGRKLKKILYAVTGLIQGFVLMPFYPIVHVHQASRGSFYRKLPMYLWGFLLKKKVILHLHGGGFVDFYRDADPVTQRLIRYVLNHVSLVMVLYQDEAFRVLEFSNPKRVEVLTNGR